MYGGKSLDTGAKHCFHIHWDEKYETYFAECDEIWHAGDIGSTEVADKFEAMKPTFRAVYGNCDGYDLRVRYPEINRFKCEDVDVMTARW